ncbi:methionine--tRNA ligase [Helicobacter sp. MIT 14-3879]|uniref:methionine--tRNA ligase n=1 Tax=Helicobacter sp. MIT 14-3879 TaxID=2040649 RepID=UPI000E1F16DD|nr:methionine--tRNA ligase [Helicobacter sp. MIT 14-3879]RDU61646.1 methionine--tRNA ligase [Helicobacter sp. MIT 14-3879]
MTKYITTPIYYVNDIPHIGHAYTTILVDMFKKYQELKGNSCILLTGTDEHGQKIENSAKMKNKSPQEYADSISFKFRSLWDSFNISYDYFIRTTDSYHNIGVKKAFEVMFSNGDIYKDYYEGNYCVSCETFFTKRQLLDNLLCPDCGKETTALREESYFFRLSKYQDKLLEWYKQDVIFPLHKKNEVIRFVESGLSDLSITRSTFKWGIELPKSINDNKHIIYVWLDALLSYITPLGFGNNKENKMKLFDDATHFVGKDILRFHAVYWPAFLFSLNLPLPKKIYAHGWWLIDGAKMSKSVGNVVNPKEIADTYGLETMRYFLISEVSFGQDGDFSIKALTKRANSELSDKLGNLLNRLLGMSEKYFNFNIESSDFSLFENEIDNVNNIINSLDSYMENMMPNKYLEELWSIFDIANITITKHSPWEMIKNNKKDVSSLLVFIANILAKGALMVYPILPQSSIKIMESLGINESFYKDIIKESKMIKKFTLTKIPPLFPKLEVKEEQLNKTKEIKDKQVKEEVNLRQFDKLDIRIGKILSAKKVKDSTKLLVFSIDFGEFGVRQIVSGIANFYKESDLVGINVCAIINLKPSKIRGIISEGMLLTAEDSDGNLELLRLNIKHGSKVC